MVDFPNSWMWSEACDMLARAEKLHREFFRPAPSGQHMPSWEPPVDVIETEREVLVLVALPGVDPDLVEAVIDGADLIVGGVRVLPAAFARGGPAGHARAAAGGPPDAAGGRACRSLSDRLASHRDRGQRGALC